MSTPRVCAIADCDRLAKARGWCSKHYQRWQAHGDPNFTYFTAGRVCKMADCDGRVKSRDLCQKHYWRVMRHGNPSYGRRPRSNKPFHREGYLMVYDPTHPNAHKGGAVAVHTMVMAELLGRPLLSHEQVHHKNGVRDDNRPENLELWAKSQPAGARVPDLIEYANWVIETYGSDPNALCGWNGKQATRSQYVTT